MIEYKGESVGRNDPCKCGSGKKFKKCCLKFTPKRQLKTKAERRVRHRPVMRRSAVRPSLDGVQAKVVEHEPVETNKEALVAALRQAKVKEEVVYAHINTGLFITQMNAGVQSQEDLDRWNVAIKEYRDQQQAGNDPSGLGRLCSEVSPP